MSAASRAMGERIAVSRPCHLVGSVCWRRHGDKISHGSRAPVNSGTHTTQTDSNAISAHARAGRGALRGRPLPYRGWGVWGVGRNRGLGAVGTPLVAGLAPGLELRWNVVGNELEGSSGHHQSRSPLRWRTALLGADGARAELPIHCRQKHVLGTRPTALVSCKCRRRI
jgi:hypothetical protein